MITVLVSYKLKEGVSINDYKKYSLSKDQPLVKSFDVIDDIAVYIVEKSSNEIDIFEVIKVKSLKDWKNLMGTPEMKENARIFETLCDKDTVKTFYGQLLN